MRIKASELRIQDSAKSEICNLQFRSFLHAKLALGEKTR
jgi:hypothetical protein